LVVFGRTASDDKTQQTENQDPAFHQSTPWESSPSLGKTVCSAPVQSDRNFRGFQGISTIEAI
jgi:hypothetical protein